ncbi:LuxR C-terminal-related transcriptional regulator [Streptomyces sp. NPDC047315]|uniref:helix-turn-helix transcriptional regulator n=1 Tax=Streptomyces sp. NPDC047315 TaxID=3155142 RepID=UPI0033F79EB6
MLEPRRDRPREHREAAALLADGAARARAGEGGLVLVRGATGTGRTTVLDATVQDAAAHGMRVLRVRCAPGDTTAPFAAALQLLAPLPGFESPDAHGDERERAAQLWRALCSYAEASPLLLAVDDVHLADGPSRRWLVEAARQADRLRLLLAVTERSQYDVDPPAPGFAHTLPPARVRTHTLPPLDPAAAAGHVRTAFPTATDAWVDDCVRAAAGSPLLLRALLDDLGALGAPGRHSTVPDTAAELYPGAYAAAVQWWLDSAGPGTKEVARSLAALDEGWDRATAAGADSGCPTKGLGPLLAERAGADPARVTGWLTAAAHLGVLNVGPGAPAGPTAALGVGHHLPRQREYGADPQHARGGARQLRYAHRLLRDAVLSGVPTARRRATHRAAAEAMVHCGASTGTVARQLLLAAPVGATWTPTVLRDAASHAVRAGRDDDAVAFLRRALDEPLSGGQRQRLLTELGSLECAGRETAAGIPRLREALRLPGTPQDKVRAAVALGTALSWRGSTRAAVEVLRTVDGELAGRPEVIGPLRTASIVLSDQDQTVREEVHRWLNETDDHSPEPAGPASRALRVRYDATAALTSADEAMRRLHALLAEPADPATEPFLLGTAAAVAQWADRLDEAERLVERGLAGQRRDVLNPMHHALLNVRADIAAARGEYGRLPDEPLVDGPTGPTNVHAHTLIALVETGRPAEAARLADGFDLGAAPDSWELNRFLYARGVQRAAAGDAAGALHDFLECGRRQSARDVVSPLVTPWRSAAAECRLALGGPGEARELAEEELRLARVWGTPRTVGRALRVLGTVTGGRRGWELTEEAVLLLRGAPAAERELVAALIAQGRLLTAVTDGPGGRSRARDSLREAADRAERLGAPRLRTLAEAALRDSGARRPTTARTGSRSLTPSERRIAGLAVDGLTNTEIAGRLYLARRTVETHLTSTYKKLGIRRRSELKEALAAG